MIAVRNTLEALAQRPAAFLGSVWPWRALGFLLSGAVVGATAVGLAALTVLLWGGLGPGAVAVVPPPLALAGWAVAGYERWRLRLVLPGRKTEGPAVAGRAVAGRAEQGRTAGGRRGRARELLLRRRPAARRDLGYGLISLLLLWWIDLGLVTVGLGTPLFLLAAPFQPTANPAASWLGPLAGLVLLPVAAYPLAAWAGVRAVTARALLEPAEDELTRVVASRARLVDAYEVERRRIERDLHDGAQQRLVSLSVKLGLAGLDLPEGSAGARQVREAREEVRVALRELRELIHGIHPQVLTDRGLEPAVRDLAGRSAVPVDVDIALPGRPPAPVEAAAYFVVCEALANVVRHSGARRASVHGRAAADGLVLEIRDDGGGGADPAAGTGLLGIGDRLAVIDGTLSLRSPAGGPTVLRVEIPCRNFG
ncbi:sensor histidine kinase [Kitasatospora sp. NPDC058444]|uniref:sensor histidine kinase n=1 Tax=Kitasatospora sp. NPDC058444 TaxID=3346504 RepID=UPI0036653F72